LVLEPAVKSNRHIILFGENFRHLLLPAFSWSD
jgi:hypothetical protein